MCGIVGYVGPQAAVEVVVNGLRRLEYRGYDSAGIAVVHAAEDPAQVRWRSPRRPASWPTWRRCWPTSRCPPRSSASATPGGPPTARRTTATPTRTARPTAGSPWSTTGSSRTTGCCAPSWSRPASELLSDTDTEIVAHLLGRELFEGFDLAAAMRTVCARLDGAFTLVAVDAQDPDSVVAARRNSPLVVGVGRGRELRRLRRGRLHRAHPGGDRTRPGPGGDDHPRRRLGHRLRRRRGRGPSVPRRLGPVGRREGRLRLVHAQGDLRAAQGRSPTRCSAGTTSPARSGWTRSGSPKPSCAASTRSSSSPAARPSTPVWWPSTPSSTGPGSPARSSWRASSATATRSSARPRWWSASASPGRPPTP